jgi:signal transduction histidine kinase
MALATSPEHPRADHRRAPAEILVGAILEGSAAELGWLAWLDGPDPVVLRSEASSPIESMDIAEFPDAPAQPLVVDAGVASGTWQRWCAARGIQSCVIVPVLARGRAVGTMGLASSRPSTLGPSDVRQLASVSSLAVYTRAYETRLAGQRRLFAEVSPTLENALALDRLIRQPPTYRQIARAVGDSIDASYCLIAIQDSKGALTLRAAAGQRAPRPMRVSSWPLRRLSGCARALRERHAVVLSFNRYDPAIEGERRALFSPTTQVGVIVPFFAGARTQGVLVIGEERRSRRQPLSPERLAILELVASRIAHILRISRRLESERRAERRRQRQLTIERQQLAREVHDGVGQALTALLVQVRGAMTEGHAGPHHLRVLERSAVQAVDGARALAYGIRRLEGGIETLEEARGYAQTMLHSVHCRLSWTEERTDLKVAGRVAREIARVIKESIIDIVRQAKATSVRVRVEYPDEMIRVTIQDDAVGVSRHDIRPNPDRLDGTVDVRRARNGGGTLISIEARRH